MNAQRAIDKAQRRWSEASWTLAEAKVCCPKAARRDRQLARAASRRAGRQQARAEERVVDEGDASSFCDCSMCVPPLPKWADVLAMPAGCRYFGDIEPFAR